MRDSDLEKWRERLAWFESERTANRIRDRLAQKEEAPEDCIRVESAELALRVVYRDQCDGSALIRHYATVDDAVSDLGVMFGISPSTVRSIHKRYCRRRTTE